MVEERQEHIKWSDKYSMGIKLIDDQHKGLLDFVNELFSHVTGNEEEERVYFDGVIQQALEYVSNHFVTEEECMRAENFPDYTKHQMAHNEFKLAVIKSANGFNAGEVLALMDFARFLENWIITHVAGMDKEYSHFFRKTGAIKKDGKLNNALEEIIAKRTKLEPIKIFVENAKYHKGTLSP